jgi:hypothetical protein
MARMAAPRIADFVRANESLDRDCARHRLTDPFSSIARRFIVFSDARSHLPKAVKAILDGKKLIEVAQIFGVTRHAVRKWIASYQTKGLEALAEKRRGRPTGGSLKSWQANKVSKTIQDRLPDRLKMSFYLWARESAALLIAKTGTGPAA